MRLYEMRDEKIAEILKKSAVFKIGDEKDVRARNNYICDNNNKYESAADPEEKRFSYVKSAKDYGTDLTFARKIVWKNAIGFLFLHLVALYGLYLGFSEAKLYTTFWMLLLIMLGGEGITIGAHRLWSHRSFKVTRSLSTLLLALQTLAGQNCLWVWARDHRQHHRFSDTDADPHNAKRGFFFSHIGWLMSRKHPLVIEAGKTIDMSDLEADPLIMLQKKYYKPLYVLLAMIIPIYTPVVFWNEKPLVAFCICYFTRFVIQLNFTWAVNSVAHLYGTKPYDKNLMPVESLFVSTISNGEGWHNYHHTFPWDYKAAEFGTKFNLTASIIRWLARRGWAYDLKEASDETIYARALRTGDGSHYKINSFLQKEKGKFCDLSKVCDAFDNL